MFHSHKRRSVISPDLCWEMLGSCGQHGIVSDIEMINIQHINEAYERLLKGDVRYRFVINM